MIAGQRLYTNTSPSYQVMLFPLPCIYISQGENGQYSHQGTLNIDFLGWNSNGRVHSMDYYAPADCECVMKSTTAYYNCWNSLNEVYCADGVIRYVCWQNIHGNYLFNVGQTLSQGDKMGVTGSYGMATGDHLHFNTANGHYAGQQQVPPANAWTLRNSLHIYNVCFINDTTIYHNIDNYPWVEYHGGIIPPIPPIPTIGRKSKFPWVLYSRKLRNKRLKL